MDATSLLQARTAVAAQMGFPGFDTTSADDQRTAYRNLSAADQVRFTDQLSAYIYTNPTDFTSDQLAVAKDRIDSPAYNTPLADTSYTAAVGEFIDEAYAQGKSIFTSVDTLIKWLVVGTVAVALVYALKTYVDMKKSGGTYH